MVKTLEGMITVSEMVVYEGMIRIMEREDEEDLTKELDMNLHSSIIQIVEKTSHADIVRLVKEYKIAKATALCLRMNVPLMAITKKVSLYWILKEGVSEAMSLEKFMLYKLWKKSQEQE